MDPKSETAAPSRRAPRSPSRGLLTVVAALALLVTAGFVFAPSSVSSGAVQSMLPFAAVLAIVALGQTLVVMQGGIDLSVAGSVSLVIVIVTHQAYGDDSKVLPAALLALGVSPPHRARQRPAHRTTRAQPDRRHAGHQRPALRRGAGSVRWHAPSDHRPARSARRRQHARDPARRPRRGRRHRPRHGGRQEDGVGASLRGRGRQPAGPPGPLACACRASRPAATSSPRSSTGWAALLLAGILNKPTAYQGDSYLLASVAAVVLGGTSLLGGRGNLVATAIAALFLIQLDQFVLALGFDFAGKTLVQSAAFAIGVALYTINWSRLRQTARPSSHHRRGLTVPSRPHPAPPDHQKGRSLCPDPPQPFASSRCRASPPWHSPRAAARPTAPPLAPARGSTVAGAPSWCGSKKVTLGLTDGFGGNSWRLVTTASAKDEIAKCPSVTSFTYADGQGDTQKAISDVQGLVAKGSTPSSSSRTPATRCSRRSRAPRRPAS